MTYDVERERTVLFGGETTAGVALADTWEWDGDTWTQVADTGPAARYSSAMAYNSTAEVVILFGGYQTGTFGDTWAWDGTTWTQLGENGPSRHSHAMAYDSRRDRVGVFGGYVTGPSGETWEWNGVAWTRVADFGPAPRFGHAMAFDGSRLLAFGGGTTPLHDTWGWDGRGWTWLQNIGPGARLFHSVAWDSTRSCAVLFGGGSDSQLFSDTWELATSPK